MRMAWLTAIVLLTALVAGCGSGGSAGTAITPSQNREEGTSTTATIQLKTAAPSPETVLYAVEVTLHLPAGVTVSADSTSGAVSAGVLQAQDQRAFAGARYLAATGTSDARVIINIADPSGFPVGALATVSCVVSAGTALQQGDFTVGDFSARDANGQVLSQVTPAFALLTQ